MFPSNPRTARTPGHSSTAHGGRVGRGCASAHSWARRQACLVQAPPDQCTRRARARPLPRCPASWAATSHHSHQNRRFRQTLSRGVIAPVAPVVLSALVRVGPGDLLFSAHISLNILSNSSYLPRLAPPDPSSPDAPWPRPLPTEGAHTSIWPSGGFCSDCRRKSPWQCSGNNRKNLPKTRWDAQTKCKKTWLDCPSILPDPNAGS